jgi:ABC-2 type transport system permease protein
LNVSVVASVPEVGARFRAVGTRSFVTALWAEWTKLRTLAGTWWLLLAVIALPAAGGVGGGR